MARRSSTDRLVRLLALPAWVADNDGATFEEAATHFGVAPEVIRGDVARHLVDLKTALEFGEIPAIDAVVLDPSREGANRTTLERLDALDPKRILYVACDPASLGRDTGILRELGWDMVQLRAFDMYPNTHHVESVALFERAPAKPRPRRRRTK